MQVTEHVIDQLHRHQHHRNTICALARADTFRASTLSNFDTNSTNGTPARPGVNASKSKLRTRVLFAIPWEKPCKASSSCLMVTLRVPKIYWPSSTFTRGICAAKI